MAGEATILNLDFGDILKNIVETKRAIAELKDENKELKKAIEGDEEALKKFDGTIEDLNKALAINESTIRNLGKEQRTLTNIVDQATKQEKAHTGSIEANRAELSRLTAEYIKLANPTKEQTARIKQLSERLKEQEGAIGNTSRNVGNYTESIEAAAKNLNIFGVNIGQTITDLKSKQKELTLVKNSMISFGTGTASVTGLLKLFKVALAATGIGLFVLALGSLVTFLTKTQRGIEIVNKASAFLKATFDVLIDRVSALGEGLFEIFSGNFAAGVDKLKNSFKGVTDEIIREAGAAKDLQAATDALAKKQVELTEVQAARRRQSEELRNAAKDETKSLQERTKFLQDALALEKQIAKDEIDISRERARILTEQTKLANSTTEELQEAATARAEADEIAAGAARRQKELLSELNGLTNKQRAEEKKVFDERKKQNEAALADLRKSITDEGKLRQEELDKRIESFKKAGASEEEIAIFTAKERAKLEEELTEKILDELDKRLGGIERTGKLEILKIQERYNQEIIAAQGNREQIEEIEKEKQKAILKITEETLRQQLIQLEEQLSPSLASLEGGLGETILSEEQKEELNARIQEVKTQLSELGVQFSNITFDEDSGEKTDLLSRLGLDDEGQERFDKALAGIQGGMQFISDFSSAITEKRINDLEKEEAAALELAESTGADKTKIEEDFAKKKQELITKNFKVEKATKIVETIITTAQAAINAFNSLAVIPVVGTVLGAAAAAAAAAFGAAQIAVISSSQPPKFAEGGVVDVEGKSHDQGGTTYVGEDGNAFEVEKGEKIFVMKKTASRFIEKYGALNEMFGGRSWNAAPVRHAAQGGNIPVNFDGGFTARSASQNVDSQLQLENMLANMPTPIVRVSEIDKVQTGRERSVSVSEL